MMRRDARRPSALFILLLFILFFLPDTIKGETPNLEKFTKKDEPITIKADTLEYNKEQDIYKATGNVEIIQGKVRITGDAVTVDNKTGDVHAAGNVVVMEGEDRLSCETVKLNMNTKAGIIHNGNIFMKKGNYHIEGDNIERVSEEGYKIDKASITTCDAKMPDWRFRATDINIYPDDYFTAWNFFFYIKDIPSFYSPYIILPIKTKRHTGFLIPRVGYSTKEGFKFKEAFYWVIADNMDATIYTDYRSKKGLGTALEYRYVLGSNSKGNFYTNYVNEWLTNSEKWEGKYLIEHRFTDKLTAKIDINYLSDRNYYKEYSETLSEKIQRSIDSNAYITQSWPTSSLYLWTQFTKDLTKENDETIQKLPELGYKMVEQRLFDLPVFYSLDSTAANFWSDAAQKGQRIDINPKLKGEFKLFRAIVFSPRGELRETLYSRSKDTEESTHRFIYTVGAGLTTKIDRVFKTEGLGAIERIRHSIEPEIDYEYIPNVEQSQLPQFDSIDNISKKNAFTYAITNRFSARYKKGGEAKRLEFLTLKLSQSYDINEVLRNDDPASSKRPLSDIRAELNIKSEQMIRLFVDSKYNPYTGHITQTNTDLRFQMGRTWYLTIGERYSRDSSIEFLTGGMGLSLPSGIDASGQIWYDITMMKLREQAYTLKYNRQCWSAGMSYKHSPDKDEILFTVELKGIGAVKLH
ncbi:MAG: LPS-assembly protein LptD [Nitrospirae bacterium]|nr:LPS-assembly protein LptD [Nitrospirota bacterium]